MSECRCDRTPFALLMIPIIIMYVVVNSHPSTISLEQQKINDDNWQKSQDALLLNIDHWKLPLGVLGLIVIALITKKAYEHRQYSILACMAMLVLGGAFFYTGNLDFSTLHLSSALTQNNTYFVSLGNE